MAVNTLMPNFNPGQIMMNANPSRPFLQLRQSSSPAGAFNIPSQPGSVSPIFSPLNPPTQSGQPPVIQANAGPAQATVPTGDPNTLGAEAVRDTGTGPFDAAFRQNLATYAGGQFQRPNGFLGFNVTGNTPFGTPTGGGSAPLPGMGGSLLQAALGGQAFGAPAAPAPTPAASDNFPDLTRLLRQFGPRMLFPSGQEGF